MMCVILSSKKYVLNSKYLVYKTLKFGYSLMPNPKDFFNKSIFLNYWKNKQNMVITHGETACHH